MGYVCANAPVVLRIIAMENGSAPNGCCVLLGGVKFERG